MHPGAGTEDFAEVRCFVGAQHPPIGPPAGADHDGICDEDEIIAWGSWLTQRPVAIWPHAPHPIDGHADEQFAGGQGSQ